MKKRYKLLDFLPTDFEIANFEIEKLFGAIKLPLIRKMPSGLISKDFKPFNPIESGINLSQEKRDAMMQYLCEELKIRMECFKRNITYLIFFHPMMK